MHHAGKTQKHQFWDLALPTMPVGRALFHGYAKETEGVILGIRAEAITR